MREHLGAPTAGHETVAYDDPLWFFYTSGTTGRPKAGVLTHGQMAFVVTNHLADLIPGTTEHDCSHRGGAAVARRRHPCAAERGSRRADRAAAGREAGPARRSGKLVREASRDQPVHGADHRQDAGGASGRRPVRPLQPALRDLCRRADVPRRPEARAAEAGQGAGAVLRPRRGDGQHHRAAAGHAFGRRRRSECQRRLVRPAAHRHGGGDPRRRTAAGAGGRSRRDLRARTRGVRAATHDNPEATAKALRGGWFHTGDLGQAWTSAGLLYITGRESDMYISGGSNVYPREVEEVLLDASRRWPRSRCSACRTRSGARSVSRWWSGARAARPRRADALLAHLEGRCAATAGRSHVLLLGALPKSGYGKIAKKDIRQQLFERGDLQA